MMLGAVGWVSGLVNAFPRENRLIQKIDVDYAKIPGEGRPHVEFWARDVK